MMVNYTMPLDQLLRIFDLDKFWDPKLPWQTLVQLRDNLQLPEAQLVTLHLNYSNQYAIQEPLCNTFAVMSKENVSKVFEALYDHVNGKTEGKKSKAQLMEAITIMRSVIERIK